MQNPQVLRGATLNKGDGSPLIHGGSIVIRDGKIEDILTSGAKFPKLHDYQEIDVFGKYAVPGLIDAHLHLQLDASNNPMENLAHEDPLMTHYKALERAQRALAHGVTSVRDCGSRDAGILRLRDAINESICQGPHIISAGTPFNITGGHFAVCSQAIDGKDEMRKAARQQLEAGADFIKLMATGGFGQIGEEPGLPELSVEEMTMAVDEAHRLGKKVAAHAYGRQGIRQALDAGVDVIEHCTYVDEELIDIMVARGTWAVPTLSNTFNLAIKGEGHIHPYINKAAKNIYQDMLEKFHALYQAGIKLAAGSDGGSFLNSHEDVVTELEIRTSVGVSPQDALSMATYLAAELCDVEDKVGTLESGKCADILIVDGDPLDNIANLRNIALVMKEGKIIPMLGSCPVHTA